MISFVLDLGCFASRWPFWEELACLGDELPVSFHRSDDTFSEGVLARFLDVDWDGDGFGCAIFFSV